MSSRQVHLFSTCLHLLRNNAKSKQFALQRCCQITWCRKMSDSESSSSDSEPDKSLNKSIKDVSKKLAKPRKRLDQIQDISTSGTEESAHLLNLAKAAANVAEDLPGDKHETVNQLLTKVKQHKKSKVKSVDTRETNTINKTTTASILDDLLLKDVMRYTRPNTVKIKRFSDSKPMPQNMNTNRAVKQPQDRGRLDNVDSLSDQITYEPLPDSVMTRPKHDIVPKKQRTQTTDGLGDILLEDVLRETSRPTNRSGQRGRNVQFLGERLNKFSSVLTVSKPSKNHFDILEEEERNTHFNTLPSNGFDEHIEWTKKGRMWKFPVDNEYGMAAEKEVSFVDHVFLDHHLEGFPQVPSIAHYMELVVVGLSRNPYMTVEEKVGHINWYKEYFNEKLYNFEDEIRGEYTTYVES